MGASPPTKITVVVSGLLLVAGIVIALFAASGAGASAVPFIPGLDGSGSLLSLGLILEGFSWFLFFLGTRIRGM